MTLLPPLVPRRSTASAGNLMYVKEDIILPYTISFYDLIVNKAMGKSGPLFQVGRAAVQGWEAWSGLPGGLLGCALRGK